MAVATRADSNYRGKGYATKAAKKGLNWYTKNKDRLGYESLEWLTRKDNQSSMRIAKDLGFEEKPGYKKMNGNLWKTYYVHSDEGGEDFMYVDELLDRSDELMHYGTPRHSGRYPWGSGERPFQRQGSTRLHNYMSSDKLSSIHKSEEDRILKEAGYKSREEFREKFLEGMRTGSPVKLTSDDVKVLSELNKLDKEYSKASKKSKRLDKHVDMTMNNMGRFWNFDEYATADARAKRKINDYEKKEGHKLTEDEKQRVLLEEYRKIKKRRTALAVGSAAAGVAAATVAPELLLSPLAYVYYSDTDQNDYMAALLDKADDLEHGGPGSGRYEWGSGERPFQHRKPAGFMLPARGQSSAGRRETSSSSSKSTGSSNSSSSNTGDSSQYDHYKAEEAQYKRNEERRKQQKHAADMADRARKIRKEDAKEKTDKAKAEEKEREDLEDAYWKEVTNMTNQLSSIRTHAKNLKAASKPVKDVTKKMSDQQLTELTNRLKLENSYLKELNTRQGYNARPDKVENLLGLLNDVSSMGRSASKVYRTANKQRKYL